MGATRDNRVHLTVYVVLFVANSGRLYVLLIRRPDTSDAYPGFLALPGGYVDHGERTDAAARRELAEETNTTAPDHWHQVGIYDEPDRDPRGRVISVAYAAVLPHLTAPRADSDAAAADWLPLTDVLTGRHGPLAFDHAQILTDAHHQLAGIKP
jgi:8-oxo-dGTP diphosphatase